jgi:O-antigen/teichoic acid export membrane protein
MSTVFWGLNRPKQVALGQTLEAIVFLLALYPLITILGLTGAAWAGVIAYGFACLNRLVAMNRIIPGITLKLFRVSLWPIAAAAAGLIITTVALSSFSSPLTRVIFGGLLATMIPAAILFLVSADLRKWLAEWFS